MVKKKNKKKSDKNVSKRYPNGRTIKTQDKYLPTDKKGNSAKLKTKRRVVVVDSNRYDELAVVRLTTQNQPNTTELRTYKKGNGKTTYFKHFVEIMDDEGNPIKIDGKKFIENPWAWDLSNSEMNEVYNAVFKHSQQAGTNIDKIKRLKSREKKENKKSPRN